MIGVYRSETGQYVLVHPETETTVIDDSLERGFERIHAFVKGLPAEKRGSSRGSGSAATPDGGGSRLGLLALLVLLPFVWLGVLHYSLASLVTDFNAHDSSDLARQVNELEKDLLSLRTEVNRLGNAVTTPAPAPTAPAPAPTAPAPAPTAPSPAPAPATPTPAPEPSPPGTPAPAGELSVPPASIPTPPASEPTPPVPDPAAPAPAVTGQ